MATRRKNKPTEEENNQDPTYMTSGPGTPTGKECKNTVDAGTKQEGAFSVCGASSRCTESSALLEQQDRRSFNLRSGQLLAAPALVSEDGMALHRISEGMKPIVVRATYTQADSRGAESIVGLTCRILRACSAVENERADDDILKESRSHWDADSV